MGIEEFIEEDSPYGDITSDTLLSDERVIAEIKAKEDCIISGIEEAKSVFEFLNCRVECLIKDGREVKKEADVMRIEGKARSVLRGERLALNFLMRMSGIATITRNLVSECRAINPNIKIACTRKTTPGFRYYEKKAVSAGGGDTHRFNLSDAVLIKDNHIKIIGSVEECIKRARNAGFTKKIEIEVDSLEDALKSVKAGADIIMLDNFLPDEVERAVKAIRNVNKQVIIEVSGGIRPENIKEYARYADVISLGFITHSSKAIDFSLEISQVV